MPTNILFLAETNLSPSLAEQRARCEAEGDLIVEAGQVSFLDLPKKLAQSGYTLEPGDKIKVYDLTCLPVNTATLVRMIVKLLRGGVAIELCSPGLVIDPDTNEDMVRLLVALDSHWRRVHGMKTHPTNSKTGRKPLLTADRLNEIKAMLAEKDATYDSVAEDLGVGRTTLYDYLQRHKASAGLSVGG